MSKNKNDPVTEKLCEACRQTVKLILYSLESYSEEKKLSEKIRKREYMRKKYDFKTKRI